MCPTGGGVAFTPTSSGPINLELQDSGADANYMLDVRGTSQGTVRDGRIEDLQVTAGHRFVIEVELSSSFQGTLRIVANAV